MGEANYYIHVNGVQRGPFSLQQLVAEGVTPETMIWRPGLQEWVQLSQLPEVMDYLFLQPREPETNVPPFGVPPMNQNPGFPQNGQPSYHQNPYGIPNQNGYNPNYGQPYGHQFGMYPPGWTNWLPWAIVATVVAVLFCGLLNTVFGIVGIVKANSANDAARRGAPDANDLKNSAKTWTIISFALSGLALIIAIFMFSSGFSY